MQHAMIQPVSLNRILWFIFAAVTLITQNWYSFSAVLPILQPLWNLTATQTGLIVASFQFGYVLSVLICSFLAIHTVRRKFLYWEASYPAFLVWLLSY